MSIKELKDELTKQHEGISYAQLLLKIRELEEEGAEASNELQSLRGIREQVNDRIPSENDSFISKLLVKTDAYTDLEEPVILTSGELGIYYINTEKTLQDGGEWKEYGDDSKAMIDHTVQVMKSNYDFKQIIDILVEETNALLLGKSNRAISGGQRRDWLFSGPVADKLDLPHISLYKNSFAEMITPSGRVINSPSLEGIYDVHIVDMITMGSSVYSEEDPATGWVPMLREEGAEISDLLSVVTRCQGGEGRLRKQGIITHPFVAIDADFLDEHSANPQRALAYIDNPKAWSENYLRENGALALVDTFDPDGKKTDRAGKFLKRYGPALKESGRLQELEEAVQEKFNYSLDKLRGE